MSDRTFANAGACVFDAYGTLFDVHSAAAKLSDRLGDKAQALSSLWRQKQLEYTWLRSLMGRHADFWQVTGDALDHAMAATGFDDPKLRERLMQLYLSLDAYGDVTATLERLRSSGLKTAILSNGEPRMLSAAVETAGIGRLLDEVLSIEEVGIYKPDPRVYQLAVDRLATRPERIVFISTNAWDAAGATAFGFVVAWLNRFRAQPERLGVEPAATISGLDELPGLLGV